MHGKNIFRQHNQLVRLVLCAYIGLLVHPYYRQGVRCAYNPGCPMSDGLGVNLMNKTTVINYSKNGARHVAHMRGLWSREAIRAIVERYNWRMVSAAHVTRRGDDLREPIRYAIIKTGGKQ